MGHCSVEGESSTHSSRERHGIPIAGRAEVYATTRYVVLIVILATGEALASQHEIRGIRARISGWGSKSTADRGDRKTKDCESNHYGLL